MRKIQLMRCLAALLLIAFMGSCKSKETKAVDQQFVIGQTKMDAKDYRGAITAFYSAIKINPKNYEAYHQIGLAYMYMNQKNKGLANLNAAVRLMEKNEDLTKPETKDEYNVIYKDYQDYKNGTRLPGSPDGGAPAASNTATAPQPDNTPADTASGPR